MTFQLTRSREGIELYHPPLRTPLAAGSLALFGLTCLVPGCFAAIALAPLVDAGAAETVGLWLMSIFILPFLAFGVVFLGTAVYLVTNSLTVNITASEIRSLRRVLGFALPEHRVAHDDVAALEAVATLRNRWPGATAVYYSLVATTGSGPRARKVTVAETLLGDVLVEKVRAEIVQAGRLEHLAATPERPQG